MERCTGSHHGHFAFEGGEWSLGIIIIKLLSFVTFYRVSGCFRTILAILPIIKPNTLWLWTKNKTAFLTRCGSTEWKIEQYHSIRNCKIHMNIAVRIMTFHFVMRNYWKECLKLVSTCSLVSKMSFTGCYRREIPCVENVSHDSKKYRVIISKTMLIEPGESRSLQIILKYRPRTSYFTVSLQLQFVIWHAFSHKVQ